MHGRLSFKWHKDRKKISDISIRTNIVPLIGISNQAYIHYGNGMCMGMDMMCVWVCICINLYHWYLMQIPSVFRHWHWQPYLAITIGIIIFIHIIIVFLLFQNNRYWCVQVLSFQSFHLKNKISIISSKI